MKYGIYHMNCEDGIVSAILLKKQFPDIILFPASFDGSWKDLPMKKGDELYFVDISPKPEEIVEFERNGMKFLIIDHHVSAFNLIQEYKKHNPDVAFSNYLYYPGVCSSVAIWNYFFKGRKMPEVLKFIDINDLWKWDLDKNSRYVNQYIKAMCKRSSFEDYQNLLETFNYDEAADRGKLLYQKMMQDVEYMASRAAEIDFDGVRVPTVNTQLYESEVGHLLASQSKNNIGIVYELHPDGNMVKFHVRGNKGDAARKLAEKYGGGGHDLASGFTMSLKDFSALLKKNWMEQKNERR